nr:T9SS type A sorting domain-containing protein [Bacteroidales bacterium]
NYNGYYYHLDPAEAGLYILGVYDEYGDGNKGFQLKDGAGNAVFSNSGNFGSEAIYFLNITNNGSGQFVGIESATNATTLNVYPNPVIDELRVECGEAIRNIEVLDVTGRTVYSTGNCDGTIDTDGWQSGMYIIRVTTDNGMSVQKFVKQ